jgi:hypothetical protein
MSRLKAGIVTAVGTLAFTFVMVSVDWNLFDIFWWMRY